MQRLRPGRIVRRESGRVIFSASGRETPSPPSGRSATSTSNRRRKKWSTSAAAPGWPPLRAHLSHLFETEKTARKVSFWYGARSRQELFYQEYFEALAKEHSNFTFHAALSSPLPDDNWSGPTGFIHEVVRKKYLAGHENPKAVEFYLCGPPMMIKACTKMLSDLGVGAEQIAFDEF
ncbi:MAG: hypothetical protein D4R65_14625 [Verrucomicrobiaceae bacterium]|nr:MAG: hypothetical protein D4R65_14625 [Verrucomicrobiaceae bacterium]